MRGVHCSLALVLTSLLAPGLTVATELTELPHPNLELIDEEVAAQLEERREEVEALFAGTDSDAAARASALGDLGGLYYLYDYIDLARWCFAEAARLAPNEPRWPYLTGLSARLDGDLEAAERAFTTALELAPEDVTILVRLGDAQLARGRSDEAAESYREAVERDPNRPAAHYGLGRVAAAEERHEDAVTHFGRALELQPEATSLHHQIGMAQRALGDLDAARASLAANTGGRIRVLDPVVESLGSEIRATSRWFSAGTRAMRGGEYEEAIRLFLAAAEERPDDHLVDYNLALAYLRTGRRQDAITALESSLAKDPDFRNGHYNLGLLLLEDGRVEEAERSLARAHEIDPDDESAHLEWARALAALGRSTEAESELRELVQRAPQLPAARLELARLHLARGAGKEAAAGFERVLAGDAEPEEFAVAHLGLGRLADQRGNFTAAVEHYQAAVAASEAVEARLALAAALGRIGAFDEAAASFTQVIEEGAAPVEAHFGRAMALLLGEAERRARTALEESMSSYPTNLPLRHLYARLLATSDDASVRDGARALELARQVFEQQQTLAHAETVAMALAETGEFAAAVDWQRRVVAEAGRSGRQAVLDGARRRLAAYEQGETVRSPWKSG